MVTPLSRAEKASWTRNESEDVHPVYIKLGKKAAIKASNPLPTL